VSAITLTPEKPATFSPTCDAKSRDALRPGTSRRNGTPLTLNDIHARAYSKWLAAGRPESDSCRFWLEAEQELLQGKP
jgi:hypothetical protein